MMEPVHRIRECVRCEKPAEARDGYDWCAHCRTGMWCACEACEVLMVLASL